MSEELIGYVARYGACCRDCSDENGICPSRGLPCDDHKAIAFVIRALEYGFSEGYIEMPASWNRRARPNTPAPSELVERLKEQSARLKINADLHGVCAGTMLKAADHIDQQAAEIARLTAKIARLEIERDDEACCNESLERFNVQCLARADAAERDLRNMTFERDVWKKTAVGRGEDMLKEKARAEQAERERDEWKEVARKAGVCMSCALQTPEPYGCTDCLNSGWNGGAPHGFVAEAALAASEARNKELREALEELKQAAVTVAQYGAQLGSQWTRLNVAIVRARAVLTKEG